MYRFHVLLSASACALVFALLGGVLFPAGAAKADIITTCASSCPSGYHYIGESPQYCDNPYADAIRCESNDGHYFTQCDGPVISCPTNYFNAALNSHATGGNANCPVGNKAPNRVLCKRTMGQSFKTCGNCPSGYSTTNVQSNSDRCVRDNLLAHDLKTCVCDSGSCVTRKPLKRYYRWDPNYPGMRSHAFAVSSSDVQRLQSQGYNFERVEGYVYDFAFTKTTPLYELYYINFSTMRRDYYYTVSPADRDTAISLGYQYMGPVGYVTWEYQHGVLPTKRLLGHYLYANHDHFYTVSQSQSQTAINMGYTYEGPEGRTFNLPDWNGQ